MTGARFAMFAAAIALPAQTLQFEVASVKPSAPGGRGGIVRAMPGNQTYIANNIPLKMIMTVAYTVTDRQISGGPDWVATEPFDINAKAARPGTIDELHVMLQHLLEDRFQLKLRRETREAAVWALVVDKGGSKLVEHDAQDLDHPPMGLNPRGGLSGKNLDMGYFAFILSRLLDRNVVNKTGLTAHYDLDLQYARDRGPGEAEAEGPTIFTALREQLGVRLEAARAPVEHVVIESAARPSAN
jgi:uncharacterized protein (TIGR03435 family)